MGKGDVKTTKGKRARGSYGKTRKRPKNGIAFNVSLKNEDKDSKTAEVTKTTTAKKTPATKKPAVKKSTAKKATATKTGEKKTATKKVATKKTTAKTTAKKDEQ